MNDMDKILENREAWKDPAARHLAALCNAWACAYGWDEVHGLDDDHDDIASALLFFAERVVDPEERRELEDWVKEQLVKVKRYL